MVWSVGWGVFFKVFLGEEDVEQLGCSMGKGCSSSQKGLFSWLLCSSPSVAGSG